MDDFPKHPRTGVSVLPEVYAVPGQNGFYYREKQSDSVMRYIPAKPAEARIEALEAQVREQALQILASEGQAADAYEAQLKAEAQIATARADALRGFRSKMVKRLHRLGAEYREQGQEDAVYAVHTAMNAVLALIDTPAPDPVQEAARTGDVSPLLAVRRLHDDLGRSRLDALERGVTETMVVKITSEHADALRAIAEGESK